MCIRDRGCWVNRGREGVMLEQTYIDDGMDVTRLEATDTGYLEKSVLKMRETPLLRSSWMRTISGVRVQYKAQRPMPVHYCRSCRGRTYARPKTHQALKDRNLTVPSALVVIVPVMT